MAFLGGLFGGIGKAATGIGDAVATVGRVYRGDKSQIEAGRQAAEEHVHDEQMAVLAQHAAEVSTRKTATWFDAFVDGLNRLPRPMFVLWIWGMFVWPWWDVSGFTAYMLAMELVPESIWSIALVLIGFYFGGRIISQDIRKPAMTPEQKKLALDVIREREQAIIEARTPLVVTVAPSPKPPPPAWAVEVLNRKPSLSPVPAPSTAPEPGQRPEFVDKMVAEIIKKEGGAKFTNDPSDSGGPTKFGVTLTTLSEWRERECTADDVKNLGRAEAEDIYRTKFYYGPSIDSLPLGLQHHVFDCAINMGPRGAVRLLQKSLNALGCGLKEDGVIGPATRHACSLHDERLVHNTLVDHRIAFYKDLAARRPKDKRFLNGWLKRAETFRA